MTPLRRAALPMYGLPEVRGDIDVTWMALRAELGARGVDAPDALDWPADLHRSWEEPTLLLSQTCGYPLVAALRTRVRLVGTFASDDVSPGGRYRSVIVTTQPARARVETAAWPELTAAVNDEWSLSGWVSLLAATTGTSAWSGPVVMTGAHASSVESLRRGQADIASIDAVTFALLRRHRPGALEGLEVVGEGPLVPALPLITSSATTDATFAALREALAAVVTDERVRGALDRQLIDDFVALDAAAYLPVTELVTDLGITPPTWP